MFRNHRCIGSSICSQGRGFDFWNEACKSLAVLNCLLHNPPAGDLNPVIEQGCVCWVADTATIAFTVTLTGFSVANFTSDLQALYIQGIRGIDPGILQACPGTLEQFRKYEACKGEEGYKCMESVFIKFLTSQRRSVSLH